MSGFIFDCEHFLSLSDGEVIKYAEPFVTTQADMVPDSAYEVLAGKFDQMSEIQTVYALEICMRISPQEFVSKTAEFLSHSDSSVCCTASRLIETVPPESVSRLLVKRIAATPVVNLFASHVRTGERLQIGTNEKFIRALLDKFKYRTEKGEEN